MHGRRRRAVRVGAAALPPHTLRPGMTMHLYINLLFYCLASCLFDLLVPELFCYASSIVESLLARGKIIPLFYDKPNNAFISTLQEWGVFFSSNT